MLKHGILSCVIWQHQLYGTSLNLPDRVQMTKFAKVSLAHLENTTNLFNHLRNHPKEYGRSQLTCDIHLSGCGSLVLDY